MSASIATRPRAITLNVRQRSQQWLSAINLHWAGVGILGFICLYLLLRMGVAWQQAQSQNADALARQQVALTTAKIAAQPLEGLDAKIATASHSADKFYQERLPISYSEVAGELGDLKKKCNVRLTRAQYAQKPVADDAAGQLNEVDIDASLSGDYRPLMLFINGLERDKLFFVIGGVTLTGQQSGAVNVRMRVTTYLRGTPSDDERQKVEVGTSADGTGSEIDSDIEAAAKRRIGGAR